MEPLCPVWRFPSAESDAVDFGSLISQLLEVVLALVGNQRWQGMLQAQLQPLLHLALGYMQMTAAQVRRGLASVSSQSGGGTRVACSWRRRR